MIQSINLLHIFLHFLDTTSKRSISCTCTSKEHVAEENQQPTRHWRPFSWRDPDGRIPHLCSWSSYIWLHLLYFNDISMCFKDFCQIGSLERRHIDIACSKSLKSPSKACRKQARPSDSSILLNSARSVFGSQKFWRKAQLAACYVCSGLDWLKLVLGIVLHFVLILSSPGWIIWLSLTIIICHWLTTSQFFLQTPIPAVGSLMLINPLIPNADFSILANRPSKWTLNQSGHLINAMTAHLMNDQWWSMSQVLRSLTRCAKHFWSALLKDRARDMFLPCRFCKKNRDSSNSAAMRTTDRKSVV